MPNSTALTRSQTHDLAFDCGDTAPANLSVTWRQGYVLVELATEGFVVAWQTYVAAGEGNVVLMQRLDGRGASLGEPVQMTPEPCAPDLWVAITPLLDNGFVVLWRERATQANFGWGQRVDRDGRICGHPNRVDLPPNCMS